MLSRRLLLAAALAAACAAVTSAPASRACSVCQCGDPLFSSSGTSSQTAGSFSFYLESQFFGKSSGVLPHDPDEAPEPRDREHSDQRDLTLWASWTPAPRVTVSASLPFRWITVTEEHADGDSHEHSNRGFGDASLYLTSVLWQDLETKPLTWLELRGMLKLPTGQSQKTIAGEDDPHLQVGTGSWDFGFGLGGGHHFERFAVYGSAFYRLNRNGSLDYRYGDVLLANLIVSSEAYPIFGGVSLRPSAELNFRWAAKDEQRGVPYKHSGGAIVYVTPTLEIPLTANPEQRAPWLRLAVRMPLGDSNLNGRQHEGFVYTAGVGLAF